MSHSSSRSLALAFVRRVVVDIFGDFVTLVARTRTDCYQAIEESIRRHNGIPVHDLLGLEEAVKQTVPESCRHDVVIALTRLSNAYVDELVVREQAAYVVGLTVGQTFSTSMLPDSLKHSG